MSLGRRMLTRINSDNKVSSVFSEFSVVNKDFQ
jgi:hypothetical protein